MFKVMRNMRLDLNRIYVHVRKLGHFDSSD